MSDLKETDIYNQKISKDNYKDVLKAFFIEFGWQLLTVLLFGTTIGLYFVVGFLAIVGIIPIGLMMYYLIKRNNQS